MTAAHSVEYPPFLDPGDEFTRLDSAAVEIIPVPYDGTSTWQKGADLGPAALLAASTQVETLDIETETQVHLRGVATRAPIFCDGSPEEMCEQVEAAVGACLDAGRFPVVLGGEHSVTIGALRATKKRHPGFSVLQIDAHADTREAYHGSACNHACVMARAREMAPICQVGIRSLDRAELDTIDRSRVLFAHQIRGKTGPERVAWVERALSLLTDEVYITIDLDAFDPSLLPATGTPEPGGLLWDEVNSLLDAACGRKKIIGFDVVELCPRPGQHASEFVAAKLTHRLLSRVFAQNTP